MFPYIVRYNVALIGCMALLLARPGERRTALLAGLALCPARARRPHWSDVPAHASHRHHGPRTPIRGAAPPPRRTGGVLADGGSAACRSERVEHDAPPCARLPQARRGCRGYGHARSAGLPVRSPVDHRDPRSHTDRNLGLFPSVATHCYPRAARIPVRALRPFRGTLPCAAGLAGLAQHQDGRTDGHVRRAYRRHRADPARGLAGLRPRGRPGEDHPQGVLPRLPHIGRAHPPCAELPGNHDRALELTRMAPFRDHGVPSRHVRHRARAPAGLAPDPHARHDRAAPALPLGGRSSSCSPS